MIAPRFKPLGNPILILSDRPEDASGLARVARDLAGLLVTMPEFRVGVLGRGGVGRRKFPWTSYAYPEAHGWGEEYLAEVAEDFFGADHGIVFTNWDLTRVGWLARPDLFLGGNPRLARAYGLGRNWDLWGYFPVDSTGPDGRTLPIEQREILRGFGRVMAASEWGQTRLRLSGRPDAEWLPHGLARTWHPGATKESMGWPPDAVVVGCVMTNQARKDWGVAIETAKLLHARYGNRLRFWAHTNELVAWWNLPALLQDYGLEGTCEITRGLSDEQLNARYGAADCMILPSGGEGFGFPIAEALGAGTGTVVTDYGAGQELVPEELRVRPVTTRLDTAYNVRRAVLGAHGFARAAEEEIARAQDKEGRGQELARCVEHLAWERLRWPWMKWFREGLRG